MVSVEESSTQVEVAFTRALIADGKDHLLDDDLLDELASGVVPDGDDRCQCCSPVRQRAADDLEGHQGVHGRRADRDALRPARHTRTTRPGSSRCSAIVKTEFPHLEKIHDPGELEAELDRIRIRSTTR